MKRNTWTGLESFGTIKGNARNHHNSINFGTDNSRVIENRKVQFNINNFEFSLICVYHFKKSPFPVISRFSIIIIIIIIILSALCNRVRVCKRLALY